MDARRAREEVLGNFDCNSAQCRVATERGWIVTFAERLRIAIEQNGFTPMSFAEHLGWSIQRLSLHISQNREPRLSTLQLFIKELPGVDIVWLVTGSVRALPKCTAPEIEYPTDVFKAE
jgi:hypothetical protein